MSSSESLNFHSDDAAVTPPPSREHGDRGERNADEPHTSAERSRQSRTASKKCPMPFRIGNKITPRAGYDPISSPEDEDDYKLATFANVVGAMRPSAFAKMLDAWLGRSCATYATELTWGDILSNLDLARIKRDLRSAGVKVVVDKDPRMAGFVGTVIDTDVPGDFVREDPIEAYLKALALAKHQAGVCLSRVNDASGETEVPTQEFRRLTMALAVRDMSPSEFGAAIVAIAAMPIEPGEEELSPTRWGWTDERKRADDKLLDVLRSGEADLLRPAIASLAPHVKPFSPHSWTECAREVELATMWREAAACGYCVRFPQNGVVHKATLNGQPLDVCTSDAVECGLKAMVVAQHEAATNLVRHTSGHLELGTDHETRLQLQVVELFDSLSLNCDLPNCS